MIIKYTALTVSVLAIFTIPVNAQYEMVRINQDGDVIGGPVVIGSWIPKEVCKISDVGYIYFTASTARIYCYDSSLNFVNMVEEPAGADTLGIDNVRQEIMTNHIDGISRYGPTLNHIETHEVYGNVFALAVDQSDGALWYTDRTDEEKGLYKTDHEFNPIYNFPGYNYGNLTNVSSSGTFWVEEWIQGYIERRNSNGTVLATGNIGDRLITTAMYFGTEACWGVTLITKAVVKVNSSGGIVYNNSADYNWPHDLDVDQNDGSAWIADTNNFEVVHLNSSGGELLRKSNNWTPYVIAVDPSDSTVIVIYWPGEVGIKSASLGRIKAMFR